MIVKKYLWGVFCILLIAPFSLLSENVVGEWEQFSSGFEDKYTYFRLNQDMKGILATVRNGGKFHLDEISPSQIKSHDGFIEINFEDSEKYRAKLILSGYRSSENKSDGLLTGILYMYMKEKSDWKLFNSIFVRLNRIEGKSFVDSVADLKKRLKE